MTVFNPIRFYISTIHENIITKSFMYGCAVGAILTTANWLTMMHVRQPNEAISVNYAQEPADFNEDGIQDLVVKSNQGHNTPLYGVIEDGNTIYVSAAEMLKRTPDSIVNYKTIEDRLNQ